MSVIALNVPKNCFENKMKHEKLQSQFIVK